MCCVDCTASTACWIPACAGMTVGGGAGMTVEGARMSWAGSPCYGGGIEVVGGFEEEFGAEGLALGLEEAGVADVGVGAVGVGRRVGEAAEAVFGEGGEVEVAELVGIEGEVAEVEGGKVAVAEGFELEAEGGGVDFPGGVDAREGDAGEQDEECCGP